MRTDIGKIAISLETFENKCRKYLDIIHYSESGLIVNFEDDHHYIIPQLLDNKKIIKRILGPTYSSHIFSVIELTPKSTFEDIRQGLFTELIDRKIHMPSYRKLEDIINLLDKKNYRVGIFILRAELMFSGNNEILYKIQNYTRNYKVSFLAFSPLNLVNPQYNQLKSICPSLFKNIIYEPIYESKDIYVFFKYLEDLFHIKLSKMLKKNIYDSCGGDLWLVKQAVRYYRNNPQASVNEILSHNELLEKASLVWDRLLPSEKKVATKMQNELPLYDDEKSIQQYLSRIRFFKDKTSEFSIPIMSQAMHEKAHKNLFMLHKNGIYFGNKLMSHELTKQEKKILVYFIERKEQIISRYELGECIWKNSEDSYSDCALDRLIYLLREKLFSLCFPKHIIKTKRGEGYVFSG